MPATPRRGPATTNPAGGPAQATAAKVRPAAVAPPSQPPAEATCPFHGRDIRVAVPTPEQMLVLTRLADRFAPGEDGSGPTFESGEKALAALNRMLNAVTALIVDDDDVEFVEDLLVARRATMEEIAGFTRTALDLLVEANPSAASTTSPPGKRARLVLR